MHDVVVTLFVIFGGTQHPFRLRKSHPWAHSGRRSKGLSHAQGHSRLRLATHCPAGTVRAMASRSLPVIDTTRAAVLGMRTNGMPDCRMTATASGSSTALSVTKNRSVAEQHGTRRAVLTRMKPMAWPAPHHCNDTVDVARKPGFVQQKRGKIGERPQGDVIM